MSSSSEPVVVTIRQGRMVFIYADAVAALLRMGLPHVRRASRVEPGSDSLTWEADMTPMGGPVLRGFDTREAALVAERAWLRQCRGL